MRLEVRRFKLFFVLKFHAFGSYSVQVVIGVEASCVWKLECSSCYLFCSFMCLEVTVFKLLCVLKLHVFGSSQC